MEIVLFPLGISTVVIAVRLLFCETNKSRVIACFLMPLASSLLSTSGLCLLIFLSGAPVEAYNGYAICLFILPMSLVWSYIAIPSGIVLYFLLTMAVAAFIPYKPYKSDAETKD